MKKTYIFSAIFTALLLATGVKTIAQVGINTVSPVAGALLDISSGSTSSTDKRGLLIPRVQLSDTGDTSTISPSATVGLLVYNTITSGALPFQVTPGFYYWNGSQWLRFYNRGYGIKFDQTSETRANNSSTVYTQISGLDTGNISVPYSGTYQIKVEVTYACGNLSSISSDGIGQASVSLNMTTNTSGSPVSVAEKYVTSTSKRIGGTTLNNLPQNTTIIYTVDLDLMNTYRFNVEGREWSRNNVNRGWFGKNTNSYPGSDGITDAHRGSISITLIRQQ